jgi:hypothetical protein
MYNNEPSSIPISEYQWMIHKADDSRTGSAALIEMLAEFFLIYDEGRRCKVIYDENIFPHI